MNRIIKRFLSNNEIIERVGKTAVMTAAGRCFASLEKNSLIFDPYAMQLVGQDGFRELNALYEQDSSMGSMADLSKYMEFRTKLGDDICNSIKQVVVIGAGLDTRAWRLGNKKFFELDRSDIFAIKRSILPPPKCEKHVSIQTDLADPNWKKLIQSNGFDIKLKTAWIAEGIFMYLEPKVTEQCLNIINSLSAPGSRLFFDHISHFPNDSEWSKIIKSSCSKEEISTNFKPLISNGWKSTLTLDTENGINLFDKYLPPWKPLKDSDKIVSVFVHLEKQ